MRVAARFLAATERVEALLYRDDPLHGLHDRNLDMKKSSIVSGSDALLGDIFAERPGAGVGRLRLATLTGARDCEIVVLYAHLDVVPAEAGHLHRDRVALLCLINVCAGLDISMIASSADKFLEKDVEVGVGAAIHETEHCAFLLG